VRYGEIAGQSELVITEFIKDAERVQCVECPLARIAAANVLWRQEHWDGMIDEPETHMRLLEKTGADCVEAQLEFGSLVESCDGFSKTRSPDNRYPAGMCNSPDAKHPKISIAAGRILEAIDWIMPAGVRKILGR
jgi:hypothetical protein